MLHANCLVLTIACSVEGFNVQAASISAKRKKPTSGPFLRLTAIERRVEVMSPFCNRIEPSEIRDADIPPQQRQLPCRAIDRMRRGRVAVLFTKTYGRVLAPGLTLLDPKLPDHLKRRSPLATTWRQLDGASTTLQTANFSRLENLTDS